MPYWPRRIAPPAKGPPSESPRTVGQTDPRHGAWTRAMGRMPYRSAGRAEGGCDALLSRGGGAGTWRPRHGGCSDRERDVIECQRPSGSRAIGRVREPGARAGLGDDHRSHLVPLAVTAHDGEERWVLRAVPRWRAPDAASCDAGRSARPALAAVLTVIVARARPAALCPIVRASGRAAVPERHRFGRTA